MANFDYVKIYTLFKTVCERWGISRIPERWDELERMYDESHRYYHTMSHIERVINRVEDLQVGRLDGRIDADWDPIFLAIFYHDAIYEPGWDGNEQASAIFAAAMLNEAPQWIRIEVIRLINLTKTHDPLADDFSGQLIVDADLYELTTDRYDENRKAIRKEFARVSEEDFRKGRAKWLAGFVLREKIFSLSDLSNGSRGGYAAWEFDRLAKKNMIHELCLLVIRDG